MAVGQCDFPHMLNVKGITLGTTCAGIKQTIKDDILVIQMAENSTCAAVFTQNAFCAAPVHVAKAHLAHQPRWLLINSGNANAGTGEPLPQAIANLQTDHWEQAAHAIMTTDTFPKGVSKTIDIDGHTITINGISKGAGMIQPNMATMLGFIATDAKINQVLLQQCLSVAVEQSFNRITVDGDTSTNDACVVMASGCSSAPEIIADSEYYSIFAAGLMSVCKQLAEAIVRDGEGATKLIRIIVEEALNDEEAVRVGKTIAHSPLVKTAFFASDPNWGRILAAVGRSGIDDMVLESVQLFLNEVCIVRKGGRATDYTEEAGQQVMNEEEITVTVKLGRGNAIQEVLTCDLSYDYVKINAEYRT
ncbi:MAG: bifunctional glutamate N-acetyltransferase/amino-acid acetyltransferase ArgJ [Methylococcales bacterium]|nr:bifunctional glutamate N-acetyltransferase/amino-acid acetyltransferase ArgJ [Methylococcales bacterium]